MRIRNFVWLFAAFALVGCNSGGGGENAGGGQATPAKKLLVGIVFDSGGIGDKSFNDSANAGVQKAAKDLGADIKSADSKSEKDYETNLTGMAEKGCNVIFAVGYKQETALKTVAPKYPNISFAIVDDVVDLPNVRSLVFAEEQGSFLAGYLAALVSKTAKVGFVGGETGPLIKKFESGYVAGAKTANPAIDASGIKYTESWDDTSTGKLMASTLFTGGCDVVYHAAGRCGLGVISAAKDAGKFAIGVDSDQDGEAPGNVLTSMVKHVDVAVFDTIKDVNDGKFKPGVQRFDLKTKGVGLTDFQYTKDKIGDANIKKIQDISQQIIDGKIKVPATDADLKTYLAGLKKTP
ncbi:MAG: BMP family ABC transporter substrate-binding protein [Fimbriimonas sp.]|nr:BMP family ABC transporter substrate-binding protein [Fimbriimonas sp.]